MVCSETFNLINVRSILEQILQSWELVKPEEAETDFHLYLCSMAEQ
jgi:hypothetical protein